MSTFEVIMLGLWKMAWAWGTVVVCLIGGAIYEHRKYK